MTNLGRPISILLVEDSASDDELAISALECGKIANELSHVRDGVEAMDYLRRQNGFEDATRPDLIFLDLNMPRKDGRKVLREIREDPALRSIPVVVLTTSAQEIDILEATIWRPTPTL